MASRRNGTYPDNTEQAWLRDCLHDLRDYAQSKGLNVADAALRDAIVAVSLEADIATQLSVKDLINYGSSKMPSNSLDT